MSDEIEYLKAALEESERMRKEIKEMMHNQAQQVQRVRELHKQISGPYDDLTCKTCAIDVDNYPEWPCPTIKALDGEK